MVGFTIHSRRTAKNDLAFETLFYHVIKKGLGLDKIVVIITSRVLHAGTNQAGATTGYDSHGLMTINGIQGITAGIVFLHEAVGMGLEIGGQSDLVYAQYFVAGCPECYHGLTTHKASCPGHCYRV